MHAGNLFLGAGASSAGERRKAVVLAALAAALQQSLPSTGAAPDAVALVIEMVQAEADQLRLKLDGGWPWETFATERTIYRIQHGDAHWKSRSFRTLSMVPALVLPPKWFYAGRRWLGAQTWYKRARTGALPVPGFTKVDAPGVNGATAGSAAANEEAERGALPGLPGRRGAGAAP